MEAPATDDNTKKIEEPVKSDKEAIVEEEKAATEEKKDEEKAAEAAGDKKEDAAKGAKKAGSHQKDPEEDMVYLFQFQRSPCIPSISPFCLKLESWLKLHGIKYTVSHPDSSSCFLKIDFLKKTKLMVPKGGNAVD